MHPAQSPRRVTQPHQEALPGKQPPAINRPVRLDQPPATHPRLVERPTDSSRRSRRGKRSNFGRLNKHRHNRPGPDPGYGDPTRLSRQKQPGIRGNIGRHISPALTLHKPSKIRPERDLQRRVLRRTNRVKVNRVSPLRHNLRRRQHNLSHQQIEPTRPPLHPPNRPGRFRLMQVPSRADRLTLGRRRLKHHQQTAF